MGFFQLRYAVALIAAISIDALQFLLGIAIAAAFFHPATALAIVGCVAGSNVINSCWIGGVAGGVLGAIIGTLAPATIALTDAIGAGLGAVVDFCFSCIGFAIIIPALIVTDITAPSEFFVSWRRGPSIILKIIPGIDMLPFFTGMVVLSILECEAKKAKSIAGVTLKAATGGLAGAAVSGARAAGPTMAGGARQVFAQSRELRSEAIEHARNRVPLVDGIRAPARAANSPGRLAANDNEPATIPIRETPPQSAALPTLRDTNARSKQLMAA